MKQVTVVGIGSPHGADQFGWQVIDNLKQYHAVQTLSYPRIQLIACDRPGLSLLEYIKGSSLAIIVDAIDGGKAGNIRCLQQEQLMLNDQSISTHYAGVADALQLGEKLKLLPDEVVLYGIEMGVNHDEIDIYEAKVKQIAKLILSKIEES